MERVASVSRSSFTSKDVDAVRAVLDATYGSRLEMGAAQGVPFRTAIHAATDDLTTVSTFEFDGHIEAEMDGMRDVLFTDIAIGDYEWRSRGRQGRQDNPLVLPATHELAVSFRQVRSVMVTVDAATVGRWLARYGGLPPSPSLLSEAVTGSDAVRRAVRFWGEVMPSEAYDSPLVRANLLEVLLSVTATQLVGDSETARSNGTPAALRRAEEYLRAHVAEPVSVADAADAARLSVRALQDQFQRWLNLTPTQYLRNLRLDAVRSDLVQARTDGRTVAIADVARRWGFAHMGRFSGQYAAAFGETPTKTLRASAPPLATG
jgi:AraC-like DNA-binding protein